MITETWKEIWERRSFQASGVTDVNLLESLIKADGFDTGMGDYSEAQWWELTKQISTLLGITTKDALLEVGCGSGALLYCINRITGCSISGIDYSAPLVDIARKHVPGQFECSDARDLPFPANRFDFVVSHSVFQYFPSKEYADNVLSEIHRVLKKGGKACLMDLNDKSCEESYHEDRRKLYKHPEEYDQKYGALKHLFFDKDAFVLSLQVLNFVNVQFFPHQIPDYINSRFRFNLTCEKS